MSQTQVADTDQIDTQQTLGWIGVGKMGGPMARNLVESGAKLVVSDPAKESRDRLTAVGASEATSISDFANAGIVFSTLPNDQALLDVVGNGEDLGVATTLPAGATLVDAADAWGADIVTCVNAPKPAQIKLLREGATLVATMAPQSNEKLVATLAKKGVTALALDAVPRISRAQSIDVLSTMSNVAGYRAVIEAAEVYESSLRVEASITEVPCGDAVVVGELPIRGITSPEDAVATWTRSSYRRDIALAPDADAWGAACRTYEVDIRRYVTCSVVLVSYPS